MRWMTRFRSRLAVAGFLRCSWLAGRLRHARRAFRPPRIAEARHRGRLSAAASAGSIWARPCRRRGGGRSQPGIAVTNAHNANLVDPKSVIGDGDRLRPAVLPRPPRRRRRPPPRPWWAKRSPPMARALDGELRLAHGVVRQIAMTPAMHRACLFHFRRQCRAGLFRRPGDGCRGQADRHHLRLQG